MIRMGNFVQPRAAARIVTALGLSDVNTGSLGATQDSDLAGQGLARVQGQVKEAPASKDVLAVATQWTNEASKVIAPKSATFYGAAFSPPPRSDMGYLYDVMMVFDIFSAGNGLLSVLPCYGRGVAYDNASQLLAGTEWGSADSEGYHDLVDGSREYVLIDGFLPCKSDLSTKLADAVMVSRSCREQLYMPPSDDDRLLVFGFILVNKNNANNATCALRFPSLGVNVHRYIRPLPYFEVEAR